MGKPAVVILAAGKGTRMCSELVKVLHPVCGEPMLAPVLRAAHDLKPRRTLVVIGYQAERVREAFPDQDFVIQEPQNGTGHAVLCALEALQGFRGDIIVLSGDIPLLTSSTAGKVLAVHGESQAEMTVLTAMAENPDSYGRMVRNKEGRVIRIVEQRDALEKEKAIREVNTGIYAFRASFLRRFLPTIGRGNAQGEYYLTDLAVLAGKRGTLATNQAEDFLEIRGINTRVDLAEVDRVARTRVITELMLAGVTIIDPAITYIHRGVRIGRDTVIYPNCHIEGRTVIGEGCQIHPGCRIVDTRIGSGVVIKTSCVITECTIENGVRVGPFAHLRPGSRLCRDVSVGNFVEVKKSRLGPGTKANHLTYLGDSVIGRGVNVGCGTITCNYDGVKKHTTTIGDNVFVGSDVQFVAPVAIGDDAVIGAGSTITEDVPPNSLALARSRQVNLEGRGRKKDKG
ncbi:MAG: bifunctional UDP-N-acetylglucosamine diphosphorylase/glucosamine-1-phosphate N-acetyltransferase GlmU [Deltaproteobacteria bacterium]|nr:bifunctional UDP-N-acetylglucosamine diphosphorylase/glucosamine-1-phosphate N-acetyltransferase GlmU [Deltaproteobacteria bacterium]